MVKARVCHSVGPWLGVLTYLLATVASGQNLREYQTPYYIIHTDLQGDDLREAQVRMTRMFETYRARTQSFSGQIDRRFEFYLFKSKDDYLKADGPPNSAGVFSGSVLMATAGGDLQKAWPVIQHEGFHQFAKFVIRGDMPTWLNEGIAVYFQDSLFTGDTYYTGLISPTRLSRLQAALKANRLKPFKDLTAISHDQWNRKLIQENYDQAWSIVHYLVHGGNGAYQKAFTVYIDALSKGVPSATAWQQSHLPNPKELEPQWRKWLASLPPDPTADQYTQAYAQTFATYLARAAGQHQHFRNFEVFARAAKSGTVRTASGRGGGENDPWLPPRVLADDIDAATKSGAKWTLQETSTGYWIGAECPDGARVKATVNLRTGEPPQVTIEG